MTWQTRLILRLDSKRAELRGLIIFKMVAKRVLFPSERTAKRLKRIERQVALNRPEVKMNDSVVNTNVGAGAIFNLTPCRIAQGDAFNQRTGNRIRLVKIEVRGLLNALLDAYLLKLHTDALPAAADFNGNSGAMININDTNQLTEIQHFRNFNSGSDVLMPILLRRKLNNIVKYNGAATGDLVDNEVVFSILNKDSAAHFASVIVRIWYTDA